MTWSYPFFTEKEMRCHCGNCSGLPKDEFMQKLVTIREICAFPFRITSGYRCPDYNAQVSDGNQVGPHTLGLACDIACNGKEALSVIKAAIEHGMTGIGINQRGVFAKRFVHIDCVMNHPDIPRPTIWTY